MFGGYGIYWDTIIFAIVVGQTLYFRIDKTNEKDFLAYGSEPFVYEGKNRPVVMPYLALPEEVLENSKLLPQWIKKAVEASIRSRAKIKKPRSIRSRPVRFKS